MVLDEAEMKSGVPQGTILGPIMFIIYTMYLRFVLDRPGVSYHLYADDTQVYFKISEKDENYQKVTDIGLEIKNWMITRKL